MAEREQRLVLLRDSVAQLQSQLCELEKEVADDKAKLRNDPATTVQRHVRLLHEYNEIKDAAQGLMGLIADAKGVRVAEIHQEFGVDEKD
ncbi:Swi5-domain-containing protein [Penicillium odoratum]|uniref:Swi5-domain-containing protein n=1 Tax=Penicillium odoratum TaxID=1167516 RepID=UPI00254771FB|nr:Swi5-domain-containing protein [Penicillium odoratum]KAJ5765624.1 Swi5-domain-containing protein [Penicillium odoratum]